MAIKKWAKWNLEWLHFRDRIKPSNYLEIRYSDFARESVATMVRVYKFLGIGFSSKLREMVKNEINSNRLGRDTLIPIDLDSNKSSDPEIAQACDVFEY